MTETTFVSPPLERLRGGQLGGVCLGLARTTGTSHVLWRVLFLVLIPFDGLGVLLYLLCWVGLPVEGESQSIAERVLKGPDRRVTTKQAVLLAVVVVATIGALHDDAGAVVVIAAAALWFVWWRRRHPSPVPPSAPSVAAATEAAPDTAAPAPAYGAPAWVPPAPRQRSVLTPLTLSAAALVVGALLLVAAAGTASVPTEVVLSAALGVVGLGLVVSAFWGRARGLVPVAFLLALALGGTFAARPALDHGVGERHWTALTTPASYRLGIGEATLLVGGTLGKGDGADVSARVTIGHLVVEVPEGVHVVVDAHVQNGDIKAPGLESNGRRVDKRIELGPRQAPPVLVHADVTIGMVEVRNA